MSESGEAYDAEADRVCMVRPNGLGGRFATKTVEGLAEKSATPTEHPSQNIPIYEGRERLPLFLKRKFQRKHCSSCGRWTPLGFERVDGGWTVKWWRCRKCLTLGERMALRRWWRR